MNFMNTSINTYFANIFANELFSGGLNLFPLEAFLLKLFHDAGGAGIADA
jgi:hypothetical protein